MGLKIHRCISADFTRYISLNNCLPHLLKYLTVPIKLQKKKVLNMFIPEIYQVVRFRIPTVLQVTQLLLSDKVTGVQQITLLQVNVINAEIKLKESGIDEKI